MSENTKINRLRRSQIDKAVAEVYGEVDGVLRNEALYERVAAQLRLDVGDLNQKVPVGRDGTPHSVGKRTIRWAQQSLANQGLIENIGRGEWAMTQEGRQRLKRPAPGLALLAFSTKLGIGIWGDCRTVADSLVDSVSAIITSPPYPQNRRAYGVISEQEYVDWICGVLEPTIKTLLPGGSLLLVLGNDVFMPHSPARSTYKERLILKLQDRFGLDLMDKIIWSNPSKPCGPYRYCSEQRTQLHAGYEVAVWMSTDAQLCKSSNQRVLRPHTKEQLALIESGGVQAASSSSDGQYTKRVGSYSNKTAGAIPQNVLTIGHSCASQKTYKSQCAERGIPAHGAPFPKKLTDFLVRFLTEKGDLVWDIMAGSGTTGVSCEESGRRWVMSELIGQYVMGQSLRFEGCDGFVRNPSLSRLTI